MRTYLRPGKMYFILKESSVQKTDFSSLAAQGNNIVTQKSLKHKAMKKCNPPIYSAGHLQE